MTFDNYLKTSGMGAVKQAIANALYKDKTSAEALLKILKTFPENRGKKSSQMKSHITMVQNDLVKHGLLTATKVTATAAKSVKSTKTTAPVKTAAKKVTLKTISKTKRLSLKDVKTLLRGSGFRLAITIKPIRKTAKK